MPPIIKDSDALPKTPETTTRADAASASSVDSGVKQQPVALEIPVTVNGARSIEGSDKREPFSESTKTVLVFGSGAVIRLSTAMAPGQLLFVTNERTKKEVVCQVVKSKNYRSISGYVELEFTEPAVGFWGMRFPGDRRGSGLQTAPAGVRPAAANGSATTSRPAEQKIEPPPASTVPGAVAAKPSAPAPVSSKPASSIVPPPLDSSSLLGAPRSKTGTPVTPVLTSLGSEEKLIEPWLKKSLSASRTPAAAPVAAASKDPAASGAADANLPVAPTFELTRASDKPASIFAPSEATPNLSGVDLSSIARFFEVKPAASGDAPPLPQPIAAVSDAETEELKQQTARLQEQLSSMQFAETASSSPAKPENETSASSLEHSISSLKKEPVHESPAQVLEDSRASKPASVLPEPLVLEKPAPTTPTVSLESLEQEELKVPAWLEPLARNSAAPSSTQELILREKTKRKAEQPQRREVTAEIGALAEPKQTRESRVPQFGSALPMDERQDSSESVSRKRGKGMLFAAAAAGVFIVAGAGWWYMNQQSRGVHASAPATEAAEAVSATETALQAKQKTEAALPASLSTSTTPAGSSASQPSPTKSESLLHVNAASNLPSSSSAGSPAVPVRNTQLSPKTPSNDSVVTKGSSGSPEPGPVEVKKRVLGSVRLAAPKISKTRHAQSGVDTEAGLQLDEVPSETVDNLSSALASSTKEPAAPAAPVAVGGDVKPARLLSSVPPVYPALAKAQHVSGNVTVDALIDAGGRVTSMTIVSGSTLLQQAAMDALKQWKYQPATLDGKAVPMHLRVTIQFRIQ